MYNQVETELINPSNKFSSFWPTHDKLIFSEILLAL